MQRSVIRYLLGKILLVEALLLAFPLVVSFIYRESLRQMLSYLVVILFIAALGSVCSAKKPEHFNIHAQDGILTVAIGWILLSFFGALPLFFSGEIPNIFEAFFEIASGFTTTGSSIIPDLSQIARSSLFWRSFTHLIGGMGVLVFTLAILPNHGSDSVRLMRAEVPGPIFGKLVSKLSKMARIMYAIYLMMTAIVVVILLCLKVPLFDSLLLAFGTAGTGGFGFDNAGFAIYEHQKIIEWVIAFGMLAFGINFNLYYFILIGHAKEAFADEELKYYLGFIAAAVTAICIALWNSGMAFADLVRHVFFTVSSLITTTGFTTTDYNEWPVATHVILLLLMCIGGCAGSTAGGLKVSRVVIYIKSAFTELKRIGQPRRVIIPTLSGKPVTKTIEAQIANYFFVYILVFVLILMSVAIEAPDFVTLFSTVASTFNNIGPGLGYVGPTENFAFYSDWNTVVLALGMIAGRLEIFPIIMLFSPNILKKLFGLRSTKKQRVI